MKTFSEVFEKIKNYPRKQIAVAVAQDVMVLESVIKARELDIADYILVGDKQKIISISEKAELKIEPDKVYNEKNDIHAIHKAVELVSTNRADILMKGFIHTDDFLRGVLDREIGLRTGKILSHVYIIESVNRKEILDLENSINE